MATRVLKFSVFGTPQPKGSTKSFAYPLKDKTTGAPVLDRHGKPAYGTVTTSANDRLKGWEDAIRGELQRVMDNAGDQTLFLQLFDAAIRITFVFHLARPKKPKHRCPITKPDVDKLARGAIDALMGVLFRDDAQVVAIEASKVYAATAAKVDIRIEAVDQMELQPVEAGTLWAEQGLS